MTAKLLFHDSVYVSFLNEQYSDKAVRLPSTISIQLSEKVFQPRLFKGVNKDPSEVYKILARRIKAGGSTGNDFISFH